MTPSQFRQALETLAFTDGSRMVVQLASGQNISGRFQTMLTNGNGLQAYGRERGRLSRAMSGMVIFDRFNVALRCPVILAAGFSECASAHAHAA